MKRRLGVVLLTAMFGWTIAQPQNQSEKRRVAVLDFGYGTVSTSVQAIFGTNQDVGRGITDLLIHNLLNGGTYRIIERQALDAILQEQNFSNSDRANPATAAKIGKVLGVDTIILGDVTQFGRDDNNVNVGAVARRFGGYGLGNVGVKKAKAVVGITARMVDVNTGEILASVSGKGESKRSGTNLLGGGGDWGGSGGGHLDMGSSNFQQTILGEAVNEAVTGVASQLQQNAGRLPTAEAVSVEGLVADASGKEITINVGTAAGVKVGQKLTVNRVSRVIKDPATGKELRKVQEAIGEITITQADAQSAVGAFTGAGEVKVGDTVKTK